MARKNNNNYDDNDVDDDDEKRERKKVNKKKKGKQPQFEKLRHNEESRKLRSTTASPFRFTNDKRTAKDLLRTFIVSEWERRGKDGRGQESEKEKE